MSRREFTCVVAACAFTLVGCASTDTADERAAPDPTRVVTEAEAATLADVLVTNHELGGAEVEATVPVGVSRFRLVGEIDWTNHVGRLTVTPTVQDKVQTEFDVVFNQNVVFEEVPGLAERLRRDGRSPVNWVARPLDPTTSAFDIVLRLIDTAASTTRDNPVLIQSRDVTWLRSDTLRDEQVDVFRDRRTTYWVSRDQPRLLRLDAELEATSSTATIDLLNPGPRTIPTPADDDIVAFDEVRALYAELRRSN